MIKRFQLYLGPARIRALILLLGFTGLFSLILNAVDEEQAAEWVPIIQSLLVLIFLGGSLVIIVSSMDVSQRMRWLAILMPAFGLIVLGMLFVPHLLLPLLGGAIGWIVAGLFIFQDSRAPREYRLAVKHMRKSEYDEAVKIMTEVIKREPDKPDHYRFRADLLRLWNKLGRAKRDYQRMIELQPDAVSYNGLAEVCLQAGDYEEARAAALKAYELAPEEWVTSYNLGMIEDRMELSEDVINHLEESLRAGVRDKRHRLLIYFYLVRAYARMGNLDRAAEMVKRLKKEQGGIEEWQMILNSDQAETLRAVLAEDIRLSEALIDDDIEIAAVAD